MKDGKKARNMIMHIYTDVYMSNSHEGLAAIAAKENGVNVRNLKPGQFALFVNTPFNACKIYAANNVILYYRHPKNHRLDVNAVRLIPQFFDGENQDIGYNKALSKVIKDEFKSRFGKADD